MIVEDRHLRGQADLALLAAVARSHAQTAQRGIIRLVGTIATTAMAVTVFDLVAYAWFVARVKPWMPSPATAPAATLAIAIATIIGICLVTMCLGGAAALSWSAHRAMRASTEAKGTCTRGARLRTR